MSGARERLAAALVEVGIWWGRDEPGIADALLPVVQALMDEHAAAELEKAAEQWDTDEDARYTSARIAKATAARVLRDRAAALRATAVDLSAGDR